MAWLTRRTVLLAAGFAGIAGRARAQGPAGRPIPLARVRRWGCWYQSIDVDAIAASELDLIVIDQTLDGQPVSPDSMARLKRKPGGGRRLVFAYLSVGEAESTRPYWSAAWRDSPPAWLGAENPNWPGSYSVRYWAPEWRALLFGGPQAQLDRILAAGFDGVFLDRVDAYGDWKGSRPQAQDDMVELVAALSAHGRAARPGFQSIGQNAEDLLASEAYRASINAVSKESLLFGLTGPGVANSAEAVAWSLRNLVLARSFGLPVLAIEYLDDEAAMDDARSRLAGYGFVPFFGTRLLDRMPRS